MESNCSSIEQLPRAKLTLVLDMDETLVHCEHIPHHVPLREIMSGTTGMGEPAVILDNFSDDHILAIWLRPQVKEFLEFAASRYNVCIFTAANEGYANIVLGHLDPERRIRRRLFRQHTTQLNGHFTKPIDILGTDMRRTILVDNSLGAMLTCASNSILIPDFVGQKEDSQLAHLSKVLVYLDSLDDVRPFLETSFRISDRLKKAAEAD